MLKFIYTLFLGLLIVFFVGFGIATFYPAPQMPQYPQAAQTSNTGQPLSNGYTEDQSKALDNYQRETEVYSEKSKDYSRNVSLIALSAAVVLLVVGLALEARIGLLADGLLLGGTLTLLYSIFRSFSSENPRYTFIVVSIGLIATMVVGFLKFRHQQSAGAKKR